MSIVSSAEERDQAIARLGDATPEQLQADLGYWSVAKVDHHVRYVELTQERFKTGELYREADAWVDLIAQELAGRRHATAAGS